MKNLHLLIVIALIITGLSSKLYADFPKFPLLERVTGASCAPCAGYNEAGYSKWIDTNRNDIAIITYHGPFGGVDVYYHAPAASNTMQSIMDIRRKFYDSIANDPITSAPEVKINGKFRPQKEGDESQPSNAFLTKFLEDESAKRTPMSIKPTLTITDGVADISVEVFTETAMDNIKLQVLIVEAATDFQTAPGTNGERVFPFVARFAMPDMWGTDLTLAAGETITKTFQQANVAPPFIQDVKRLYVVAFVEEVNEAHNIVQAAMSCESIPYPVIHVAELSVSSDNFYTKVAHNTNVEHLLQVVNRNTYELVVTPQFEVQTEYPDEWDVVESNLPTADFFMAPGETRQFRYVVKHTVDAPSVATSIWNISAVMSETAHTELGGITLNNKYQTGYIDITEDVKNAFLTGTVYADANTAAAFSSVPRFGGRMVSIPYVHPLLFMGDILDNLDFFGFSTDPFFWIYDLGGATGVPNSSQAIMRKLQAMTNTRIFMSSDPQTFFMLRDNTKEPGGGGNAAPENAPVARAQFRQMLQDEFGVGVLWARPQWHAPWLAAIFSMDNMQEFPVDIRGVENDSIASKNPILTLNGGNIQEYYVGYYDTLSQGATPVYHYRRYIPEVDKDGYAVEDEEGNEIIVDSIDFPTMVKYDKGSTRRATAAFNFAIIPSTLVNGVRPIESVAAAIVDWMFAPVSIKDAETNISTKNGLLLQTIPNPVTSASDVIVQNTNNTPVHTKIYLLDATGNKVMDLFEGMIDVGNNNFNLSNNNIADGTYFLVSETTTGKTYMSVVMSK